ncbi:MAG TPA: DUF4468 domain-containing protein [Chitinophagales bacterium]|nr:DUF4468 domain-containing protein [Chitinophagales bacterium]
MQFKLLFLAGLITAGQAVAQKTPAEPEMPLDDENKINYTAVMDMSGTDKAELFKRAKIFYDTYFSSKTVLQEADSVSGHLEGKAQFDVMKEQKGVKSLNERVKYTVMIDVKDNKYRYQITRVLLQAQSQKPLETYLDENDKDPMHVQALVDAHAQFEKIENDLREAMSKPSSKVKKDDW